MPDVSQHRVVTPNGEMFIYADVPFDSEYTHSINRYASGNSDLFNVIGSQVGSGYCKYRLFNQSYSRLTEKSVRVQIPKENLIHCNYIAIRNGTGFLDQVENKTFFAFIESVEYVNNETSDIFFTIDYLQTYWGNYTIPANFIEREHCAINEDEVGNNIVPENFELGDLICQNTVRGIYYLKNRIYTVIMYTPNLNETEPFVVYDATTNLCATAPNPTPEQFYPLVRNKFGGFVCCLCIPINQSSDTAYALSIAAVQSAVGMCEAVNASIVSVFQITGEIYDDNFGTTSMTIHNFTMNETNAFKKLDGTTYSSIKNKKLLQYPFKRLVVSNNNGSQEEYKWELFSGRSGSNVQATFSHLNALLPDLKAFVYPTSYRGIATDYESGLVLDDFPKPCWTEDSYSKWWAQNKANFGISLATGIVSTALTVGTGLYAGGLRAGVLADRGAEDLANFGGAQMHGLGMSASIYKESALRNFEAEKVARAGAFRGAAISGAMGSAGIARCLGQITQAKATPDTTHVQNNSSIINLLEDRLGFSFYDIGITGEMAERIDSYFDMYGYQTNKVKVPNFITGTNRPIWDYIKMQNCLIKAQTGYRGIPEEAQSAIQGIFNNGITLWRNVSQVGDYNLDNHTNT